MCWQRHQTSQRSEARISPVLVDRLRRECAEASGVAKPLRPVSEQLLSEQLLAEQLLANQLVLRPLVAALLVVG
jgi:hypothetical protein